MDLAPLCHTEESFKKLPNPHRELVGDLAKAINPLSSKGPFESQKTLWSVLTKFGVNIPAGFLEQLQPEDSIEVWASDLRFVFAMGSVMDVTTYSRMTLATHSWDLLFQRDELIKKRIMGRFITALQTGEPQHDVADWHYVNEPMSRENNPFQVKIKLIAPFKGRDFDGVFAISCARRPWRPMQFFSRSGQALLNRIKQSSQN